MPGNLITRATSTWIDGTIRDRGTVAEGSCEFVPDGARDRNITGVTETVALSGHQSLPLRLNNSRPILVVKTGELPSSALQDIDLANRVQQYWGAAKQHQRRTPIIHIPSKRGAFPTPDSNRNASAADRTVQSDLTGDNGIIKQATSSLFSIGGDRMPVRVPSTPFLERARFFVGQCQGDDLRQMSCLWFCRA